jgi:hypothetical protein
MRRTKYFWRLFPGIRAFRFQLWWQTKGMTKIFYLPVAIAGFVVTMISAWMAWRFLRRGYIDYWPDTQSPRLKNAVSSEKTASPGSLVTDALQN